MALIGKIKRLYSAIRKGEIGKQLNLLKEDIDVYASRFEWSYKFPKGYQNYSYPVKFLKLFFGKNCFRYVFYYRIGPFARLIRPFFRVPYDSTNIWGNRKGVAGGVFSLCTPGVQTSTVSILEKAVASSRIRHLEI